MLKLKRFFSLWISFAWLPAIVFCIPETVFAQTSSGQLQNAEQTIKSKLSDNFKQFPLEKVFVHTDQNSYQSGETIWYKAYCQSYGKPTELSRILYVRLLDSSGKAVNENKLYLNDGAAQGNLDLSDSLKTGWYELQAFTAWMLNFKGYGFFKQQIYFRNKNDQAGSASNEPKKATYKIHFYPEGGEIVDGNLCNIAFKATDESDHPVFASGEIYGDKNTSVIRFKSIHDGMGQFELEAVAGISYVARVHFPDHSVQTNSLPVVQKNGICMKVKAIPAHKFEVKISYSGLEKKKDIIVEIKQSNGRSLVYSSSLERGTNVYSIDKESFSKGIIRITVYNSLGIPVAERIVYNDAPQETLHVSVDQKTVSHTPKGKNELLFSIKDDAGNPVKGSFSVSVNHSGSVGDNIISCLSLSAELTGFINQPANYFKNNSDSLKQYLDLVMLTNGYRHFTKLLSENDKNVQIKYAVEKKQVITGKVMNGAFNPAEPLNLTISNADSSVYFLKVFPDSSGRFFVDNYIKPGKATIYADKLIKKNLIPVKIQLDQAVYNVNDIEKSKVNTSLQADPDGFSAGKELLKKTVIRLSGDHVLKEVNIREQRLTPLEQVIKNHVQRLTPDHSVDFDIVNVRGLPTLNIIDYLQGRVPGLQIMRYVDTIRFGYHGTNTFIEGKDGHAINPPLIYVDESHVDFDEIEHISLTSIALIRFVPPPVWFAPLNGGNTGAIMVYTKNYKDGSVGVKPAKKLQKGYGFDSFTVLRTFPILDYSQKPPTDEPDFRNTLYWNPEIKLNDQGQFSLIFYNSDDAKKIHLVIQGMDVNGNLAFDEQTL